MHGVEEDLLALLEGSFPLFEEGSAGAEAGVLDMEGGLKGGFDTDEPGVGELASGRYALGHGQGAAFLIRSRCS
jgi:hypothetical protein